MIPGQLALDIDAAMPSNEEELITTLRAQVAEAGMTEAEIDAAAADARQRLEAGPVAARPAQPCFCEGPMVFAAELGTGTCGLCGREPRR